MFFESPARQKAVLFHRKVFSNCVEEAQYNHRNYLVLLSHFSENLNVSIKNLQDCIADLEEHPKFKISRTEREMLSCGLDYLCQQYLDRLCKESYYRNAIIRRDYNVFTENYSQFYLKVHKKEYKKAKSFAYKSFSQKQPKSQRLSLNNEPSSRLNSFNSKKEAKNQAVMTKPMLFQLNFSTSLEKHNEGSKMLSSKRLGIRVNQVRQVSKFLTEEKRNSEFDLKGDFVFVSQYRGKNEEQNWEIQKNMNNPVQSFSTNRVLAFRNRISTNPEHQQKQRILKQNKMLKLSHMKIQNSMNRNKVTKPFQQQIRLIVNIEK